jgi:hypothetical protein
MVRRHPSFDPKHPAFQNPTKYHDMTPFRCARDDDGDGTMSTHRFLPAKPAPKSKAACIAYFNSNTTRAYTGGAIQMSMAHTQTKDPVIHYIVTEKRTLFPVPWHLPMWQVL